MKWGEYWEGLPGAIEDVRDGLVYGSLYDPRSHDPVEFEMRVLDVLPDQRVELEANRYCTFRNGYLLIEKTLWTTHDMETAKAETDRLWKALGWDKPLDGQGA